MTPARQRQPDESGIEREPAPRHDEYVIAAVGDQFVRSSTAPELDDVGLRLTRLHPGGAVQVRRTALPTLTFMHLSCPQLTAQWLRGRSGTERGALVLVPEGSLRIDGTRVDAKECALVRPGRTDIELHTEAAHNELLCVGFGASKLAGLPFAPGTEQCVVADLDRWNWEPMRAFLQSVCDMQTSTNDHADPLEPTARALIRTMVRAVLDTAPAPDPLYARARRILDTEYPNVDLNAESVASRLGISVRTLQAAFEAEDVTVTSVLRKTRALAAVENRRANPSASAGIVARVSGFGSESSMYRAIREFQDPTAPDGTDVSCPERRGESAEPE